MVGRPALRLLVTSTSLLTATGCIEPFGGSNVQIDFGEATPIASATPLPGLPVANTHLVLWATDYVYQLDADGAPVRDQTTGEPIIVEAYVHKVKEFEIRPVIDLASPCAIELDTEGVRFPGLHVTRYADKVEEAIVAKNDGAPFDPFDPEADQGDAQDLLTAERRMMLQPLIASDLKVVSSYGRGPNGTGFAYPATGTVCVGNGGSTNELPPISCIDDASNEVRLRVCKSLWAANTDFYEGNDKVFSLPLNGTFFGLVEGTNPINGGPVGGSGMYVDTNLSGMDVFMINWEYNDRAADPTPGGAPTYGHHLLIGYPTRVTRGVVNARMVNLDDPNLSAAMAVFSDLGSDDVHF